MSKITNPKRKEHKSRTHPIALGVFFVGLGIYVFAYFWNKWHIAREPFADANIGAGLLGLLGLTVMVVSFVYLVVLTFWRMTKR